MMYRRILLQSATIIGVAALSLAAFDAAFSQGTEQTLSIMKVDLATVQSGYRTSKVVGASVVNEAKETVGKIDDLIVTPNNTVPFAVLSVGGFIGIGSKYVVVPFDALKVVGNQIELDGATKDSLKMLPSFTYAK